MEDTRKQDSISTTKSEREELLETSGAYSIKFMEEKDRSLIDFLISHITEEGRTSEQGSLVQVGGFFVKKFMGDMFLKYDPLWSDPEDPFNTKRVDLNMHALEQCQLESIILKLLNLVGVKEMVAQAAEGSFDGRQVVIEPTFYHHRSMEYGLHRDGAGNMMYVLLAFANEEEMAATVLVADDGTLSATPELQNRRANPGSEWNSWVSKQRPDPSAMKEGGTWGPGAVVCFKDEALWHASPFVGASRYEKSCDREWRIKVEDHLKSINKWEDYQYTFRLLLGIIRDVEKRTDKEPSINGWNYVNLGKLCDLLEEAKLLVSHASFTAPYWINGREHAHKIRRKGGYSNLDYFRARRRSIDACNVYKNGASLDILNTHRSKEKRRFMRLWIKVVQIKGSETSLTRMALT